MIAETFCLCLAHTLHTFLRMSLTGSNFPSRLAPYCLPLPTFGF
jgi:hypothetical protein